MKARSRKQKQLLNELEDNPLIERACKKVGIARSTFYRWCESDTSFRNASEQAQQKGRGKLNDFVESKLLENVNSNHYQSIALWLRHNTARYQLPTSEHNAAQLEHVKKIAWRRGDLLNILIELLTEERFLRLFDRANLKTLLKEIDDAYEADRISRGNRKAGYKNRTRWRGAFPYPDEPQFDESDI